MYWPTVQLSSCHLEGPRTAATAHATAGRYKLTVQLFGSIIGGFPMANLMDCCPLLVLSHITGPQSSSLSLLFGGLLVANLMGHRAHWLC